MILNRRGPILLKIDTGVPADRFTPERFLLPGALAADAVLAYHSALEVLGFAHSVYRDVYYLTTRRRRALRRADGRVRALLPPKPLRAKRSEDFGVESRERLGVKIRVTGPERALVDCFAAPRYAGGLEGGRLLRRWNLIVPERMGPRRCSRRAVGGSPGWG